MGEAAVTILSEKGVPTPLVQTKLDAPQSKMGPIDDVDTRRRPHRSTRSTRPGSTTRARARCSRHAWRPRRRAAAPAEPPKPTEPQKAAAAAAGGGLAAVTDFLKSRQGRRSKVRSSAGSSGCSRSRSDRHRSETAPRDTRFANHRFTSTLYHQWGVPLERAGSTLLIFTLRNLLLLCAATAAVAFLAGSGGAARPLPTTEVIVTLDAPSLIDAGRSLTSARSVVYGKSLAVAQARARRTCSPRFRARRSSTATGSSPTASRSSSRPGMSRG